ncbi:hypothetical protein ABK040_010826 [Willaertia magna]
MSQQRETLEMRFGKTRSKVNDTINEINNYFLINKEEMNEFKNYKQILLWIDILEKLMIELDNYDLNDNLRLERKLILKNINDSLKELDLQKDIYKNLNEMDKDFVMIDKFLINFPFCKKFNIENKKIDEKEMYFNQCQFLHELSLVDCNVYNNMLNEKLNNLNNLKIFTKESKLKQLDILKKINQSNILLQLITNEIKPFMLKLRKLSKYLEEIYESIKYLENNNLLELKLSTLIKEEEENKLSFTKLKKYRLELNKIVTQLDYFSEIDYLKPIRSRHLSNVFNLIEKIEMLIDLIEISKELKDAKLTVLDYNILTTIETNLQHKVNTLKLNLEKCNKHQNESFFEMMNIKITMLLSIADVMLDQVRKIISGLVCFQQMDRDSML